MQKAPHDFTPEEVMKAAQDTAEAMHKAIGDVLMERDLPDAGKIAATVIAVSQLFSKVADCPVDGPLADDKAMLALTAGVVDAVVLPALEKLAAEAVKQSGGIPSTSTNQFEVAA